MEKLLTERPCVNCCLVASSAADFTLQNSRFSYEKQRFTELDRMCQPAETGDQGSSVPCISAAQKARRPIAVQKHFR
jgi:hypothetical protein